MSDDKKTIQLGFRNGESVGLKLEAAEFDKLVAAIKADEAWTEIKTEKGTLTLRADRVDFYGIADEKEERRAGF